MEPIIPGQWFAAKRFEPFSLTTLMSRKEIEKQEKDDLKEIMRALKGSFEKWKFDIRRDHIKRRIARCNALFFLELRDEINLPTPCLYIVNQYLGRLGGDDISTAFISITYKMFACMEQLQSLTFSYAQLRKNIVYSKFIDDFLQQKIKDFGMAQDSRDIYPYTDETVALKLRTVFEICRGHLNNLDSYESYDICEEDIDKFNEELTIEEIERFENDILNNTFSKCHNIDEFINIIR